MSAEGVPAEREDAPVVLVVEDEEDLAELYAAGLGETYAVRTAFDGEQALELLDEAVDVVLLDRRMPRLSGDELLDRIRERALDCRVVMVSAVEPDFDVLEMGFDDYLGKPVSADELRETVDRMLELTTHDSGLQEYYGLVSKKIALEAKKSLRELAESEEYAELKAEIADRRERMDTDRTDLQEALASAAVFQDLDASGPTAVPPPDPPSRDDRSGPPGVGATPGSSAGSAGDAGPATDSDDGPDADAETVDEAVPDDDAEPSDEPAAGDDEGPESGGGAAAGPGPGSSAEAGGDSSREPTADELAVVDRLLRHDVGDDLALVSGWLERLREEVAADQRELLDRAIAGTEHTLELTRAVGDLVRAVDDPEPPDLGAVSLVDVVRREVEKARETFEDATIAVDELPPAEVRANDLLGPVVGNLLRHAVQHADADDPQVELSVEVGFHTATLRIADDGPGTPLERREALLDRGQEGPESGGQDVGLSPVEWLVDAFDGTVRFEEDDPRGTVVAVELSKAG